MDAIDRGGENGPAVARFVPAAVFAALERFPAIDSAGARVAVVGGFVRDAWLGREPRELDLLVEGDAGELARSLGGVVTAYDRFGTATVDGGGWRIDVAQARRETYARPGALPDVATASIEEDLARRDFTVNAIAVRLPDGEVIAVEHALEDLASGTLRVLHERSFLDDPTRALRLARYRARLGFAVEPRTAALARDARIEDVSGSRVGAELRLVLAEPDAPRILASLEGLLPIVVDRARILRAIALAPPDADIGMLILGAVANDPNWLATLGFSAAERDRALACAGARSLAARLAGPKRPSELRALLRGEPPEAVALAGALGAEEAAARWLGELSHVALEITGADLLAAGIGEGPQLGARLERTLAAKLDGELAGGRDAELRYATELQL
jgi:tRNA nucleotidyltransferase (CCA-adding enzyme)